MAIFPLQSKLKRREEQKTVYIFLVFGKKEDS